MKRFMLAVCSAMLVLVFSAFVSAAWQGQHGRMGKGGMAGGFMMSPKMILSMASELNLTTEQMEKIKKIADAIPKKGDNKDEMKKNMDAIKDEMNKDTPDEAKIIDIMTKINEKHLDAMKKRIHTALAVRAVLTKDQLDILKKKREEMKENWKNKQGK